MAGTDAVPALLESLVTRLHPGASRQDVSLVFDIVGSLLGAGSSAPQPMPASSALQAAARGVRPEQAASLDRIRRRLEPMSLSPGQLGALNVVVWSARSRDSSSVAAGLWKAVRDSRAVAPAPSPVAPPRAPGGWEDGSLARRDAAGRRAAASPSEGLATLPDLRLVQSLLRVAVGVDSAEVAWDPSRRVYALRAGASAALTEASMVARVGECGWLVNRLQAWVARSSKLDGSAGLVRQAMAEAVADELVDHSRMVSALEGQLRSAAARAAAAGPGSDRGRAILAEAPTVRRLSVWFEPALARLRTLGTVADATEGLEGATLASAVWRHGDHGDPAIRALVRRLLQRACVPLVAQLRRWCLEGELSDDFAEFLVEDERSAPDEELWRRRFRLRASQQPSFFSRSLCDQALLVGKSVAFLRSACGDAEWVVSSHATSVPGPGASAAAEQPPAEPQPTLAAARAATAKASAAASAARAASRTSAAAAGVAAVRGATHASDGDLASARGWRSAFLFEERGLGVSLAAQPPAAGAAGEAAAGPAAGRSRPAQPSAGLSALEALVGRLARRASARVLSVMLGRFRLREHLAALRRYLLLARGDFVQELMRAASEHLSLPASEQRPHVLLGMLEGAIRSSSAQHDDREFLDRINVAIMPGTAGDKGWDVLCLTYDVTAPISAVLHPLAVRAYERLFCFLWRVKRAEWALSTAWCEQATATHTLHRHPELASVLHRAHLLRADMGAFVSTLSSYCMFEVLETSWKVLSDELDGAEDLPAVIRAHDRYLRSVARKSLLTGGKAEREVAPRLGELLDWALQFARLQAGMFVALTESHQRSEEQAEACRREEEEEEAAATGGAAPASASAAQGRRGRGAAGRSRAPVEPPRVFTDAELFSRREARERRRLQRRKELRQLAATFGARIDSVAKQYRGAMLRLLASLDAHGAEAPADADAADSAGGVEELRFLFFRFDFNEFYFAKFGEPGALAALGQDALAGRAD
ncbi:hypothetical protein FNF31_00325 [Cafeteria roenbergensis]|uniref:Uncharacterized protein n=2 Tax=Cafeteria roenbergensis TaxID=33653 RepID=A0A5A8DSS2_CAFRO|nr:hypothetical protein FNF28_03114 [Cafeteria roenbergensis]KAA0168443.1 hypothetical protein FNF31_00325 [Cafeteria roenbergensis]